MAHGGAQKLTTQGSTPDTKKPPPRRAAGSDRQSSMLPLYGLATVDNHGCASGLGVVVAAQQANVLFAGVPCDRPALGQDGVDVGLAEHRQLPHVPVVLERVSGSVCSMPGFQPLDTMYSICLRIWSIHLRQVREGFELAAAGVRKARKRSPAFAHWFILQKIRFDLWWPRDARPVARGGGREPPLPAGGALTCGRRPACRRCRTRT